MKRWPRRGERLKGYNVALAVFDRAETFDPNIDPIVRFEAARLRDRLREYYEGDGRGDPIRIDLPKGTYTPRIKFRPAATSDILSGAAGPHAATQISPAISLRRQLLQRMTWPRPRRRIGAPRAMADNCAGLGADPDARRGQCVAHP